MMPRRLLVGCSFTYRADVSTPVIFQVQPGGSGDVVVESSQWRSDPQLSVRCYTDLYGNPCTRTVLPPGTSTFVYRAVAQVPDVLDPADESAPEIGPDDLPAGTLIFTLPSRYCLPDVLGDEAWSRFGGLPPGYFRVAAICGHVNQHLTFQYG